MAQSNYSEFETNFEAVVTERFLQLCESAKYSGPAVSQEYLSFVARQTVTNEISVLAISTVSPHPRFCNSDEILKYMEVNPDA